MRWIALSRLCGPIMRPAFAAGALMVFSILSPAPQAQAQVDDARQIVKAMSDYLANQKTISASFDSNIEVITPDLQKIQFASSGQFLLSRPNKLRFSRIGGYADVDFVFDGKKATVYGKNLNAFAQLDAPGSVDQLIDRLRTDYSVEAPGADLLMSNVSDELMSDVISARHIGRGVVDGIECDHLAFRNSDVDWQLWVEVGPRPVPHKYVITSKTLAGAPQYTLLIRDWKTDAQPEADAFEFKQPVGATHIDFKALHDIDEVPPGIVEGANK